MKILVTGANGFIGRHLVMYLKECNHDVTGTYHNKLIYKVPGCQYIKINLASEELLDDKYDCIIHCAGQVQDASTWDYIENSVIATKKIINYCEKNSVAKLIFMSSIAVYGECSGIVNEESSKTNLNDYALAKYLCENMIWQSKIQQKVVIRLSRIVGEGGFETGGFLTKFVQILLNDDKLGYTNGEMLYNNIFYISDLTKLCEQLVEDSEIKKLCIGVGARNPLTMKQLVTEMAIDCNSKSELEEKFNQDSGRLTCHLIDIKRLIDYGFMPMTVQETIKNMIEDAKNTLCKRR